MNKKKIKFDELYTLCNKEQLFTCGSNRQYEKMFELARNGVTQTELAYILYICSDYSLDVVYRVIEPLFNDDRGTALYMVQFDWSTTDNNGIETELFDSYSKAYIHFCDIVSKELNPEFSWVGSEAFDDAGNIKDGYELDSCLENTNNNDLWWNLVDINDYYRHSFICLKQMNIKQED